jgi:hypothetical protein
MEDNVPETTIDIDEGILTAMMVEPEWSQGMLFMVGKDHDGIVRRGQIGMNDYHYLPNHEARLRRMREVAQQAASLPPYFAQIDSIQYWKKKLLDLRQEGYEEKQEALVIYGMNVLDGVQGTSAFVLRAKNQDEINFNNLDALPILDREAEESKIFDEFLEFIVSYRQYDPAPKRTKAD